MSWIVRVALQRPYTFAVLALSPLIQGIILQFEERVQRGQGPGIFQPYRDLWKLFADGEYAPPMAQPYHNVVRQLEALPGRHLVLVRYAPNHDAYQEWVYNRADIDSAHIVWAREMSPAENASLIQYFHGRSVWLLEPDPSPPKLMPYPAASLQPTPVGP